MERRNWSLKALKEFRYLDSLDGDEKAQALQRWFEKYLTDNAIEDFDLNIDDLQALSELFYKNIIFLKNHRTTMKKDIDNHKKIREFLH